ncbi:MAG TPA: Bax inhibitor-1 family protein, partial [Candidatus Ozemobacteraceae bacterium]|nr:Bax inhibitor-1 family protein [Candidatus Ozemobacteraceae bacterium]
FIGGSGLGLGISILSAVLFMGFTAYDMSNIMLKFRDEEYILATVELYLDFVNLFVALLRILIHIAASNRD